jgi:superfamily I DNA/RNA helicase
MTFGPFRLKDVRIESGKLVLDLADPDSDEIKHSPGRFLSFSQTDEVKLQAEALRGKLVVTETSNPGKNSPTRWWVSVKEYIPRSITISKEKTKVIGPPGTGKTFTLINVVREHVAMGVQTEKIAFLTFTNNAADEARKRVLEAFPEKTRMDFPHFCTLHKLATSMGGLMGKGVLDSEILHQFDPRIHKEVVWMKQGDPQSAEERPDHTALSIQSFARGRCISLEQALVDGNFTDVGDSKFDEVLREYFNQKHERVVNVGGLDLVKMYLAEYNRFKVERNLADFDDVIDNAQRESFAKNITEFDLLIIDEAQDLSDLQWNFVRRLIDKANKVVVAGDDDQAIMVPFGASPSAFLLFDGTPLVLNQSRRVSKTAHDYVMKNIMETLKSRFPDRLEKHWFPTERGGEVAIETEKLVRSSIGQGGTGKPAITKVRISLKDLLSTVAVTPDEEWLIMAPTKKTCAAISNGLKQLGVPHFHRNQPILGADRTASAVRIMTIHTSKGDEANNAALVISSLGDIKMTDADPRLVYVAQTRAKNVLYPDVRD